MDYLYVIAFAVLNICFLLYQIRLKRSLFNPGIILLSFFVLVAVCAIPAYNYLPNDIYFSQFNFRNISFFPYIYYSVCVWMLIKPVMSYDSILTQSHITLSRKKIRCFTWLYIVLAILSIYIYYRFITNLSLLDNLNEIRSDVYEGTQLKAYSNVVEHIALVFTAFFSIPAKLLFFILLTNNREQLRISKLTIVLLGFSIVMPSLMEASRTASRGMAITLFVELILSYSFFSQSIGKRIKKFLLISVSAVLFLVVGYSLLVTMARFGQSDDSDAFSSLVCYWGQPTLVFNSQVWNIDKYAWGQRFFYPVAESMGMNPGRLFGEIFKEFGSCFTTIAGDILIDFSPIGGILIALIVYRVYTNWLKKKQSIGMSELYIMMFYALYIQHGALVTGFGGCINFLTCFVMYFVIKFMTRAVNTNDSITIKL